MTNGEKKLLSSVLHWDVGENPMRRGEKPREEEGEAEEEAEDYIYKTYYTGQRGI